MANSAGRVVVYGGRGALGAKCVSHFKANNWVRSTFSYFFSPELICCFQWVGSVDLKENEEADLNVIVEGANLVEQVNIAMHLVAKMYHEQYVSFIKVLERMEDRAAFAIAIGANNWSRKGHLLADSHVLVYCNYSRWLFSFMF